MKVRHAEPPDPSGKTSWPPPQLENLNYVFSLRTSMRGDFRLFHCSAGVRPGLSPPRPPSPHLALRIPTPPAPKPEARGG